MHSLYLPEYDAFIRWHQTGGDGPPVICLPGLSLAAGGNFLTTMTRPVLAGYRAVMIDYLGSGQSDAAQGFGYGLRGHSQTIAAVMDQLACGPCPVLGYSMGGTVAIDLAQTRPDLVSRLIVAEGNLYPGGGAASARIARQTREDFTATHLPRTLQQLRGAALTGDQVAGFIAGSWGQADPRGIYENARMLVNLPDDFVAGFFRLSIPRHFFIGSKTLDAEAGADNPETKVLADNGISTEIINGVGHELMLGNPAGFAAATEQALRAAG